MRDPPATIMNEEPFGPVVATTTFTEVDDVVQRANRLPYGLGAYLFSSSLEVTTRVPRLLEAGLIGVNEFNLGGVDTYSGRRKDSGYGSEGGPAAVRGYLVPKLINEVSPVGSRRAEGWSPSARRPPGEPATIVSQAKLAWSGVGRRVGRDGDETCAECFRAPGAGR